MVSESAAKVSVAIEAPPGTCMEVEVEARTPAGVLIGRHHFILRPDGRTLIPGISGRAAARPASPLLAAVRARWQERASAWTLWLVAASLVVYTLTRLIALDAFPIYFFTDEAVQTVLASDLLRDHFQNYDHELLPTYFKNGAQYNLSISVYLQALPYWLFGKSIWVTRGTAALATLAAAVALWLIMKRIFHSPYPWLAVLFLAVTPAWFLHSRTAFETSLATTFYAVFLYFYLMYRCENPRYFYGAVLMAALTFYAYSAARVVVGVTAVLLLLSDWKYHLQHYKIVLRGAGLMVLLALPFVRFWIAHAAENTWSMRLLGSYWLDHIPLTEKLAHYAANYLHGLDPLYWYLPDSQELARHTMLGYGNLLRTTMPLGLLGVGLAFIRFRSPAYRVLIAAILAAPSGAALVGVGITRVLTMVMPMALLTALALSWLLELAHRRWNLARPLQALPVFLLLSGASFYMLFDAVQNGPVWYNDYGLNGMQYGARQLFSEIKGYLKENPGVNLIVSPSWANGTDVLARFFFDDPMPFTVGNANSYYHEVRDLPDQTVFVLIPEEYAAIPRKKFSEVRVLKTIAYPNGLPGFYFVQLKYASNIRSILEQEAAQRQKLVEEDFVLDGQPVKIQHTRPDIGGIDSLFDQDPGTLFRTEAINPLRVQISFPTPRTIRKVSLMIGGTPTSAAVSAWENGAADPVTIQTETGEENNPHTITLDLGRDMNVSELWIEVRNSNDGADGNVHLWEVTIR